MTSPGALSSWAVSLALGVLLEMGHGDNLCFVNHAGRSGHGEGWRAKEGRAWVEHAPRLYGPARASWYNARYLAFRS